MLLPGILAAITVFALSPLTLGQAPEHALLNKLIGKWVMKGKIGKQETTHDVVANWVLDQGYLQIHETSREKDAQGKPQYEAIIFVSWNAKKNHFACMWLDTTEVSSFTPVGIGHVSADGKQIQFLFGDRNDGIETTFAFDDRSKSWTWNIDNLVKGKKSVFARLELKKR